MSVRSVRTVYSVSFDVEGNLLTRGFVFALSKTKLQHFDILVVI